MSKRPVQRQSQVITTFGPGAMVDLPTRSVVIGGLNNWSRRSETSREIQEPALQRLMERWMRDESRKWLPEGQALRLVTPPLEPDFGDHSATSDIRCSVFPAWFVCEKSETTMIAGKRFEGRRVVRWHELEATNRRKFIGEDGKQAEVTPIRFVAGCESGHLQDINWRFALHKDAACQEQMWMIETGSSGSPEDILLGCSCGQLMQLRELSVPYALGACQGRQPWLGPNHSGDCINTPLKLLTRSATNAYFPQVARVISLPSAGDELLQIVEKHWSALSDIATTDQVAMARKYNPALRDDLGSSPDAEVLARVDLFRLKPETSGEINPKLAEFGLLASGARLIGENAPDSLLHAETLDRDACLGEGRYPQIRRVVAVHRLREVMCLYTFTRFEPPAVAGDDIEEVALAVSGAPLGVDQDWLPAVEAFGEGIFIEFDPAYLAAWERSPKVKGRAIVLRDGVAEHNKKRQNAELPRSAAFVAIHSLSHLLISEIALDCGYPASSLRERIYALPSAKDDEGRFGILIYTASTGALGTLGGLVDTSARLGELLDRLLDRASLCSNDPVCADHNPSEPHDDRNLLGAACHGCLLIAETSCEWRNQFLDRQLLIETVAQGGAALFSDGKSGGL